MEISSYEKFLDCCETLPTDWAYIMNKDTGQILHTWTKDTLIGSQPTHTISHEQSIKVINSYSEKFYDYCIDVSSNNLLKTELTKLKSIAENVLQEWKNKNGDEHKVCVRNTCMEVEDDGELTFMINLEGFGMPDFKYKTMLENFVKYEVIKKWRLEVYVEYEQGY